MYIYIYVDIDNGTIFISTLLYFSIFINITFIPNSTNINACLFTIIILHIYGYISCNKYNYSY